MNMGLLFAAAIPHKEVKYNKVKYKEATFFFITLRFKSKSALLKSHQM